MSYPTLAPYGWGDRWEALFTEAAGPATPDPSPAAPPAHPGGDGASGPPSGSPAPAHTDAAVDASSARTDGAGGASVAVPGRVLRHDGVAVSVALPDGVANRPLRRGLDPAPVVGDWVVERGGTLDAVLPRRSLLERKSVRQDRPQSLAANVDLVLIVCGLDRPVRAGRIQRTATLAWEAGAVPAVVLTKADALDQAAVDAVVREVEAENPGLDLLVTSSGDGTGIDALHTLVDGNTVVLVGESGAGKSSLVNALLADPDAALVGRVRRGDRKGRHTTTNRQLHVVPGGGVVIDTPGIRTVGLWADTEAVTTTFDDIDELATQCRFANCEHDTEPGCAVLAAVEAGDLSADRLASWRALEREAVAAERRADPRAMRQWGKGMSRVAKDAQRRKGRS